MRALLDEFASRPGQPFALLLLPCDQFPSLRTQLRERVSWLRLRRSSSGGSPGRVSAGGADCESVRAVRAACATYGLEGPAVCVLAKADVNGPDAHPVWTFLKAAYGDSSDIGWNFGKFLVARDGNVVGRFCPPLRPSMLTAAVEKMLAQKPIAQSQSQNAVPPAARPPAADAATTTTQLPPQPAAAGGG